MSPTDALEFDATVFTTAPADPGVVHDGFLVWRFCARRPE
jgi:hypothetical protein